MDETARVEQTSGSGESLAQVKERLSGWRGNRKRGELSAAASISSKPGGLEITAFAGGDRRAEVTQLAITTPTA